ncbi:MAG: hypothetical protein A2Z69_02485 [Bacteroidetes bacterium RBG_13_44_24]|nr:MAG: hypothetical protein A2Z69_02485 [Bacteroidetes bacterium RBG_13_44_24]
MFLNIFLPNDDAMNKILKYTSVCLALLLVVFFSLDIQKIDEVTSSENPELFNADDYALRFWETELPSCIEEAADIDQIAGLLKSDPLQAIKVYSHKLGISQTYYYMVKGSGRVLSVDEEYLAIETDGRNKLHIATAFIFGNAVRDGSGKVDIDDFLNMTEFNNVSVAINKIVKERVITGLEERISPGMLLQFAGALEISGDNPYTDILKIIPVSIILMDGDTE